jgi:hypothetical protein
MAQLTSKPPPDAGAVFSTAFGGANLVTTTLSALEAFGTIWEIKRGAKTYLSYVHQNYWYQIGKLQQEYVGGNIKRAGVESGVKIWNTALDSAVIGYKDITEASGKAAILAAKKAVVTILGAALDAAIKAFL